MVLVEARMRGWGRACKVVELLDREDLEATTHEIINAVSGAHSLNRVESQLKQVCCICFDNFPPSQVRAGTAFRPVNCVCFLPNHIRVVSAFYPVREWMYSTCTYIVHLFRSSH